MYGSTYLWVWVRLFNNETHKNTHKTWLQQPNVNVLLPISTLNWVSGNHMLANKKNSVADDQMEWLKFKIKKKLFFI